MLSSYLTYSYFTWGFPGYNSPVCWYGQCCYHSVAPPRKLRFWLTVSLVYSGGISNFFFSCLCFCSHTGNIKASLRCPFRDSRVEFTEQWLKLFLHFSLLYSCREHSREMDAWSETLLSKCPHHSCGQQEGPQKRRTHAQGARQDEAGVCTCVLSRTRFPFNSDAVISTSLSMLTNLQEPVKSEEGRDMAHRISAVGYLECSAKTKDGVREVFEMATRAALQVPKRKNRRGCQLLWRDNSPANQLLSGSSRPFLLEKPETNGFRGPHVLHKCKHATEEYERLARLFKSKTHQAL